MRPAVLPDFAGPVYLDFNATTPVDPDVLAAMLPWFADQYGNAASQHLLGRAADDAVEEARRSVAELIGCSPGEIIFTSGATESNNQALKGVLDTAAKDERSLVTSEIEHKAVLDVCDWLTGRRVNVRRVNVARNGVVEVADLARSLTPRTTLVSVMAANNETGVVQPLDVISRMARDVGALVHTDATQAVGKIPFDVNDVDVDLASFSSHKMYGPKGVGALYVRRRTPLAALLHGGGHERGLRSGTLNVPGIVGFGEAARLALQRQAGDAAHCRRLVAVLRGRLEDLVPGAQATITCRREPSKDLKMLPNTLNMRFPGADAEAVLANAPLIAASSGSACTARVPEPSHVLVAMLQDESQARECIRFSVGRTTTEADVLAAAEQVAVAVERVRELTR
ncbi:cysteine desulfurase family protein [Geodermatophilus obscurus]|uniref:cysteine desulfurase family protein n=1 Tax=Geodermatophilus obscurus TaxID=1861 RepID=UPI001AD8D808|nr:cysteine desulfurase family protein [Geodermatophilus obscurus]